MKNPPSPAGFLQINEVKTIRFYFCHVRFLWRLAFRRFRRLCLDIFRRRFFLRFPMVKVVFRSANLRFAPNPVKHNLSRRDHYADCWFGEHQLGFHRCER